MFNIETNLIFLLFLLTFIIAFLFTPYWIKRARECGIVGKDMNKYGHPDVVEMGGITIIFAFILISLFYISIQTFILQPDAEIQIKILTIISTILIVTLIGVFDDGIGWKIGLKQWEKPLLVIPATIPMVVINAGNSMMVIPFLGALGAVDFGLLYPLVIVPLGIIGAANGYNMLAGHNGLEAGLGVIILSFMGSIVWVSDIYWLSIITFIMVGALLAFLVYNWYPAKVFPGDTLTYSIGTFIAIVAILGNLEKIAVILFIPFFLEFLLKVRYKFKTENFCVPDKDNKLALPDNKIYSLCHIALAFLLRIDKKHATEKNIVFVIYGFELILICFCLLFVL